MDRITHWHLCSRLQLFCIYVLHFQVLHRILFFVAGNPVNARMLTLSPASMQLLPPLPSFKVGLRKRPLWPEETSSGEYDTVSINNHTSLCVVHDGRLKRDHSTYMLHHEFRLDFALDENATDQHVWEEAAPLLRHVQGGGRATLMLFGQTGTGKTHTAYGLQTELVEALFREGAAAAGSAETFSVEAIIFEMRGAHCRDLLNDGARIKLLEDAQGQVNVVGAERRASHSSSDLLQLFSQAHALRAVAATERNAQSSRSHYICRLYLPIAAGADAPGQGPAWGELTMVDLAGSERNLETTRHTAAVHRESADINLALMTLKDCFRAVTEKEQELETVLIVDKANHERLVVRDKEGTQRALRMPYRQHKLTTLLKDCFLNPSHQTLVVATVSPTPTDVEHTRRSLEQVCMMRGRSEEIMRVTTLACEETWSEKAEVLPVRKWDNTAVARWLAGLQGEADSLFSIAADKTLTKIEEETVDSIVTDTIDYRDVVLPANVTGKELLRMTVPRLEMYCQGDKKRDLSAALYRAIRLEAARVDSAAMDKRQRMCNLVCGNTDSVSRSASKSAIEANVTL